MNHSFVDVDSFNPRVFYISKEIYNKDNNLSFHMHPFIVVIYVEEVTGSCKYRIDGKEYEISEGNLIIINPGIYHEKLISEKGSVVEYHLAFDNINIVGLPKNTMFGDNTNAVIDARVLKNELRKCYLDAIDEQNEKNVGYDIVVKSLAIKIIILALRSYLSVMSSGFNYENYDTEKEHVIKSAMSYILKHFQNKVSLTEIAENLHINSSYLSRIFKEETGETLVHYLTGIRLNMAKELLEKNEIGILSIARCVGYNDAFYFSKLFKKNFGMTPSDYRDYMNQMI